MIDNLITWAEIDLEAIKQNVHSYKQFIGDNVEIIGVVKANAYGHGLIPCAQAMLSAGATRLAVHRYYEGIFLRKNGITAPILVMGETPIKAIDELIHWQLTPTVINEQFAELLNEASRKRKIIIPIHIKIDTGMSRYGLLPHEVELFFYKVSALKNLTIEGLYTHFATADELDKTFLFQQAHTFQSILDQLISKHYEIPLIHACNSAATMVLPTAHYNAVRLGIGLYGLHPSTQWQPIIPLKPALSLKSKVARVRSLPPGSSISYGRTYIAVKSTKAALVPIGYGDGYPINLSNKGYVLIKGQTAPILGRICMDQLVVDVSEIERVSVGDEVILIGRQGEQSISAEKLAELAGTINYCITTALLPRVTRVYLTNNGLFIGEEQFPRS